MAYIFYSPTVSGARRERADNHEVLFSRINNNQRNPRVGEKKMKKKSETFLTIIPYAELVLRLNRPPVLRGRREEG